MMMLLLLHKKLHSSSSHCHHLLLRFSTLQTPSPCSKPSFVVQYLMNSCGFSLDSATKASKLLPRFDSPSKPDSILHFLSRNGFTHAHINQMISKVPNLLCCDVEKTLEPNLRALQGLGFSEESQLRQLLSENPAVLRFRDLSSKIEFWRSFFGTNERLMTAFKRDHNLFASSFDKKVMPNISILRECGISDQFIGQMLLNAQFIGKKPSFVEDVVSWADQLGIPRSSKMFGHIVKSLLSITRATFDAKLELFKGFGCSEADFLFIFKTIPSIISLSEQNIRSKMEFLVKEVGLDIASIVKKPFLFSFSLEKRLIPRHYVWKVLKKEGLKEGECKIIKAFGVKESLFIDKFILQHKDKVPGLFKAYIASGADKVAEIS